MLNEYVIIKVWDMAQLVLLQHMKFYYGANAT
jgi:hypothetical protein